MTSAPRSTTLKAASDLGDPISTSAPLIYPAFLRPDGMTLAVTDAAGVAVWDLNPEHLADAACAVAGRNLTQTEWASEPPTCMRSTGRRAC
jgi:hypothetical protein